MAVETAFALLFLVVAFAGLMQVAGNALAGDRAGNYARALARALALDSSADPWAVLRREMGLDENHSCTALSGNTSGTCDGWTLTVDHGVSTAALATLFGGGAAENGEMVLVRLETRRPPLDRIVGIGLARCEPEN